MEKKLSMFVQLTVLGMIILIIILIIIDYHPHHYCSAPAVCGGPPGGVHPERVGGAAPVHAGTLLQPDPGHHVVRFQFHVYLPSLGTCLA